MISNNTTCLIRVVFVFGENCSDKYILCNSWMLKNDLSSLASLRVEVAGEPWQATSLLFPTIYPPSTLVLWWYGSFWYGGWRAYESRHEVSFLYEIEEQRAALLSQKIHNSTIHSFLSWSSSTQTSIIGNSNENRQQVKATSIAMGGGGGVG